MDKKALTLPILVSLVVGNMVGTGIYMLPSSLAPYGLYSLIAWGLTSLGALFLALTFAHLSKRFPKTGGPITYCEAAFGHFPGCIVAYIYWTSNLVSIAGLAIASVGYMGYLIPWLNTNSLGYHPAFALLVELAVIWGFTLINIIGVHTAGVTQLYLTIIKLVPLFLIGLLGIHTIHLSNLSFPTTNTSTTGLPMTQIAGAAALTFWAFIGLESATVPSESTAGYQTIYKATVYGTLITALVYVLSSFVLQGMMPPARLQASQFPFAEAAIVLFGQPGALIIALCAFISGVGALNGCLLLQGQIVYAAARDHYFPQRFSRLSKHDVPIAGQCFSSLVISLFLISTVQPSLLKQFDHVILLAGLLSLITYLFTSLAELKFVLKEAKKSYLPLMVAITAVVYSIWMISNFDRSSMLSALVLMAFILPIYFFALRQRSVIKKSRRTKS